jgi:hypothetical protein
MTVNFSRRTLLHGVNWLVGWLVGWFCLIWLVGWSVGRSVIS